jgi:hypothetical protein
MQFFTPTLEKELISCSTLKQKTLLFSLQDVVRLFFKIRNYDLPHVDPVPRDRDEGQEHRQLESREVSRKIYIFQHKIK